METAAKNIFIAGLRNAHSMEIQARELMERQAESLEDYPEVQAKAASNFAVPRPGCGALRILGEARPDRSFLPVPAAYFRGPPGGGRPDE